MQTVSLCRDACNHAQTYDARNIFVLLIGAWYTTDLEQKITDIVPSISIVQTVVYSCDDKQIWDL